MSDAVLLESSPSASSPNSGRRQSWGSSRIGAAPVGVGIVVVAVALRAYELRDVPRLTDETDEVMRGLTSARGESDLVVVSPRLLTGPDKDFIAEAPPGELEAGRQRRASFVVVRIVGQAEDRHDFVLVASDRPGR